MTATVHQIHPTAPRAICPACGTKATCECNVPYVTAREYAEMAVKRSPHKSSRALAAETGLDHKTIESARKSSGETSPHEKRESADGRMRPATQPKKAAQHKPPAPSMADPIQDDCDDCLTDERRWQFSAANILGDILAMRAYWAREFGKDWRRFEKPTALIALAQQARAEVEMLLNDLL